MREFLHAARNEKALEAEDARFPQRAQLRGIAGHYTAPESDVHPELRRSRADFFDARTRTGRCRNAVQRHLDQGGYAAGGSRACRG